MKHAGILATTPDGAALCFRTFCRDGFAEVGPHDHPDVTLDCIALACTELPLLLPSHACPLPALDSTRLLARAAFDVAADRRAVPAWRGGRPRLAGVAG